MKRSESSGPNAALIPNVFEPSPRRSSDPFPVSAKIKHRHRRMRRLIEHKMPARHLPDGAVVELPRVPGCEGFPHSYVLVTVGPILYKKFQPPAVYKLDRTSLEHPDGHRVVATANGIGRWVREP